MPRRAANRWSGPVRSPSGSLDCKETEPLEMFPKIHNPAYIDVIRIVSSHRWSTGTTSSYRKRRHTSFPNPPTSRVSAIVRSVKCFLPIERSAGEVAVPITTPPVPMPTCIGRPELCICLPLAAIKKPAIDHRGECLVPRSKIRCS